MAAEMDRAAWLLPQENHGLVIEGFENEPEGLVRLANARMPFGRYKGELLLDVPLDYVFWFANRPRGSTGAVPAIGPQLAAIYSVRLSGQEGMLRALVDGEGGETENDPVPHEEFDDEQLPKELQWMLSMLESE